MRNLCFQKWRTVTSETKTNKLHFSLISGFLLMGQAFFLLGSVRLRIQRRLKMLSIVFFGLYSLGIPKSFRLPWKSHHTKPYFFLECIVFRSKTPLCTDRENVGTHVEGKWWLMSLTVCLGFVCASS